MEYKVDIPMCVFKHGKFLPMVIESIVNQITTFKFRLFIADDCSSDNSREIIDYYFQKHPGIIVKYFRKTNLGEDNSSDDTREICLEYANRYPEIIRLFLREEKDRIFIKGKPTGRFNFLETLKECKGKYIAVLDGDDFWTENYKLQKQVDFLESNPDYAIHGGMSIIVSETVELNNNTVHKMELESKSLALPNFLTDSPFVTCTAIFKREDIQGIWESKLAPTIYDWFIWVYILQNTNLKAYYSNEIFAKYRMHSGGVFSYLSSIENCKFYISNLKLIAEFLTVKEYKRIAIEKRQWYRRELYREYLTVNQNLEALKLWISMWDSPFGRKDMIPLLFEFRKRLQERKNPESSNLK